jgi:hypothetical protein
MALEVVDGQRVRAGPRACREEQPRIVHDAVLEMHDVGRGPPDRPAQAYELPHGARVADPAAETKARHVRRECVVDVGAHRAGQ